MKKRLLSLLLAMILIISAIPALPAFASTAWDGSTIIEPKQTDGVYQISSGEELAWFAEETKTKSSINAVLTNDIDLGDNKWTPIGIPSSGYISQAYSGIFDGSGYTVSGLYIDTSSAFYGLFYCVYGGTVKNLNVVGNVATTGNTAGGIVGKLQGGTVENCSFDGKVSASKNYVGGIVGNIVTNSKAASIVKGCCNKGEITGKYAGGIIGYTTAKANISSCYNVGTVNGTTRSAGISAQQTAGSISYCYNIGKSASGISGFSNATITNCYYLNDETAVPGGTAKGYEKITDSASLLEKLNEGSDKLFCEDTKNKNNGYPIFAWQNKLTPEEEAAEQKKKEDAAKVKKAVEELSVDISAIKKSCTLELPKEYGDCSVEWQSSNVDIIDNKGNVTLPDKNIVNVKLTATITCGEACDTKDFTISVWSENIDPDVYLRTALDAMQWDFTQLQPTYGQDSNIIVKLQNLLKSKGFDGITVTIKSTYDENLVSKTGKIYYPQIDESSFADGRQVKVFFNLSVEGTTVTYPETDNYSLLIPWDTSSVEEKLNSSADSALSNEIIAGDNASLDDVTLNLNLPSNIGRNEGKYSFAWVSWESSDNSHISISDEKRTGGANALYNSYVGKVYRDGEEHTVTLTATIKNPSTDVAIKRTYTVVVSPLSDEELNQTLDKMNSVLSCYTEDKLIDFATKEKLNVNSVENDIQLVIPKRVVTQSELAKLNYGKYWDYWNYKFSVTSSDNDTIEINSFRAYVYRPLGEDSSADKKVTLTVKMVSKANPNLFVTKDIDVTVKHLSREDINSQLELMDKAKENYTNGLLGNNADAYSIIDNLSSYQEIVWNESKSNVDFIRNYSDIKGNGIIVDTIPNWEEQEDWRLFRTSEKDLISNETLILNKTPDNNTFVKIESVLSDEMLGKYYNKFKNVKGFDVEALAKFKQLYKQPVSAYVMVVGKDSYTEQFASMSANSKMQSYSASLSLFKKELDKPISVTFTMLGLDGAKMIAKTTETSFTKGSTVFDVFKKMIYDNNMYYTAKGSYVSSINGLAERDYGGNSGWMYSVNGVFVNSYMNAQELNGGEDIVVMYVRNYQDANKLLDNNQNNNSNSNKNNADGSESSAQKSNKTNNGKSVSASDSGKKGKKTSSASTDNKAESNNEDENTGNDTNNENTLTGDSDSKSSDTAVVQSIAEEDNKDGSHLKIIIPCVIGALLLILIIALLVLKKRKDK